MRQALITHGSPRVDCRRYEKLGIEHLVSRVVENMDSSILQKMHCPASAYKYFQFESQIVR